LPLVVKIALKRMGFVMLSEWTENLQYSCRRDNVSQHILVVFQIF